MPLAVFSLFVLGAMANLGFSYLWLARRVHPEQVWHLALTSWVCDLLFVTILVYFEQSFYPGAQGPVLDFYLFFFVIVLRGFPLLRNPAHNLMANGLVASVFLFLLVTQPDFGGPIQQQSHLVRGVFLLILILLSYVIMDVMDRQNKELALVRTLLGQSESFALLGRLSASMAHEINNPIAIISAQAQYLQRRLPKGEPLREDMATIVHEAERCGKIVKSVMKFSEVCSGEATQLQLTKILDEALEFLPSASAQFRLDPHSQPPQEDTVVMDPALVRLSILSVLLYSHQLHARNDKPLVVSLKSQNDTIILVVEFEGVQMDSDTSSFGLGLQAKGLGAKANLQLGALRDALQSGGGNLEVHQSTQEDKAPKTVLQLIYPKVRETTN
jgi:signal transduction histidine kinase